MLLLLLLRARIGAGASGGRGGRGPLLLIRVGVADWAEDIVRRGLVVLLLLGRVDGVASASLLHVLLGVPNGRVCSGEVTRRAGRPSKRHCRVEVLLLLLVDQRSDPLCLRHIALLL